MSIYRNEASLNAEEREWLEDESHRLRFIFGMSCAEARSHALAQVLSDD